MREREMCEPFAKFALCQICSRSSHSEMHVVRDMNKPWEPLESLVPPQHPRGVPGQLPTGPPAGPGSVRLKRANVH